MIGCRFFMSGPRSSRMRWAPKVDVKARKLIAAADLLQKPKAKRGATKKPKSEARSAEQALSGDVKLPVRRRALKPPASPPGR